MKQELVLQPWEKHSYLLTEVCTLRKAGVEL